MLLLSLLPLSLFAKKQGRAYIDSLVPRLALAKEDTAKVKLIVALAQVYWAVNPDTGIMYGNSALQLAQKLDWKEGLARSYHVLATNYVLKSDYSTALNYDKMALEIYEAANNKKGVGSVYGSYCVIGIYQSDYPMALDNGFKAMKITEELKDRLGTARNLTNIGIIYEDQGDHTKALEYHNKALKIYEDMNDKNGLSIGLSNVGLVYKEQKDYSHALECQLKALKICEELGNKNIISKVLGYIGDIYKQTRDYPMALEYLFSAARMAEALGNKAGMAEKYQNIGLTYLDMASDSSLNGSENKYVSNVSQFSLLKRYHLDSAISYFLMAAAIHREIGNLKDLSENYHDLSTSWELHGDAGRALQYHKLYTTLKDSVFSEQNKIKLANLETKRALDLKDKQMQLDMARKRMDSIFYISGIVVLLVITVFIYRNYTVQVRSNELLAREKKTSEDLLLNILPSEVANELKEKGSAAAKSFDNVTVLFSDFVDFTSAGERMSAHELVGELDICFKAFDDIIGKYNIEKIKTIGDAYLAVSGLPTPHKDHAEEVVKAALEIVDFLKQRKASLGDRSFDARIGIHSGAVVAGIVGLKKYAYDVWGDTVNIAARMEQSSGSGKINISQTTYELIKDKFNCTYRGEIDAKNKGKLGMYFVDGAKIS